MRFRFLMGILLLSSTVTHAQVQSPEEFLGHPVGADYTLVKWPRIVEYFRHLDAESDRITVREIGETTEGQVMILAEISATDTIANLEPHRRAQHKIADPRTISDEQERAALIRDSKVPILINAQLHSTETAASQMSMELAWKLVTEESEAVQEILDHTIVLLLPCANPDGQVMVADWYDESIGKPWEGMSSMPRLYQKYAGHDNNRDWFMLNLKETRNTTTVLYKEWLPTIVWDVHQMGNSGARLFVPPFFDPKNYNVHPIIDQTLLIIGGHMAGDLSRNGRKGVVHSAMYDNWWAGGFRTTPYRHNMVGILTEMASVNLASPVFQRKSELGGARRGMPDYSIKTNFPDPWPGGWWRLRDIVDYELDIAMSLCTLASRYHDRFQSNFIHMNEEAIQKGQTEPPFAWLVPPDQRDPRRAYEMLERLDATAVEVHQAKAAFEADGVEYPEGTFILYTAQPFRPHLMDMMERQVYPDRSMYPGGPAEPPYDMAGWTLPLQMGVRHVEVAGAFEVEATALDSIPFPGGRIDSTSASALMVQPGKNDDYRLMNRLQENDIPYHVVVRKRGEVEPGTIIIEEAEANAQKLSSINEDLSTHLAEDAAATRLLRDTNSVAKGVRSRTALYHPWTASMEEGWTRLALDTHEVPFQSIYNAEIRAGNLHQRFDCIILPSVGVRYMVEGYSEDQTAPEYVGGIGEKGIVALQEFVLNGGTLICMDEASNLPIERFGIPVKNLVIDKPTQDFYCPGSVLRLSMDTLHPVGWGMPEWYSGYFAGSQAFEVFAEDEDKDTKLLERYPTSVVSRYSDTVLLESGWIRGDDIIKGKPAILDVTYGEGTIYLLGISVQRRGQPHGTFRILFNAIQASTLD